MKNFKLKTVHILTGSSQNNKILGEKKRRKYHFEKLSE